MIQYPTNIESGQPGVPLRYLGVDVRPRSFGFVVVEDNTVLDSGVRACDHAQFDDCLGLRFVRILRTYDPLTVITLASGTRPRNEQRNATKKAVKNAAKRQNIGVVWIGEARLRQYFGRHNARTKYEIALVVAQRLPELTWLLPPKRKPWEKEHRRMSIFDAAAVVIVHAGP